MSEYESIVIKYASDYSQISHKNISGNDLKEFFGTEGYKNFEIDNAQHLDYDGLKGRVFSSSYMPRENDRKAPQMLEELKGLFKKHEKNGRMTFEYQVTVFYGELT